ncbi:hypothetical protein [Croceicoccus hydrothermalis]|uniref:hypothetical protein n=1 Tax=Croceicoccus hydrothermalis TaxID=2867964 RepID=UPI001EFA9972|nr:hypothetical protein [Croceicoccus hydrothermalis]
MRVAVLSMLEPFEGNGLRPGMSRPRARLRVGGQAVIRHQLDLALAAGAQRILLLADAGEEGVDGVLRAARDNGVDARRISDAPALCAMVSTADEILLLSDGLLSDPSAALPMLDKGSMVATLPIEPGLALGFERLDAERAWAGLLLMPGSLCERLRQLPRDCDVASSLLRIALMAGVATKPVDEACLADHRWAIVANNHIAQEVEAAQLSRSLEETRGKTPGPRLAAMAVRRFSASFLETDRSPVLLWYAALAVLLVAGGVTAFLSAGSGLLLFAFAWLAGRGALVLEEAVRQGRIGMTARSGMWRGAASLFDLVLFVALGFALTDGDWSWFGGWYLAFVLVAVVAIGELQVEPERMRVWLADRFVLCAGLALFAYTGMLAPFAMVLSALVLALWVVVARGGGNARRG